MSEVVETQDHYATLGVTPRSEDVVIRAAYLALMRRYHPDKSSAPASPARAQAIIAAFAVLGDVEKRLEYDWGRRRAAEELARSPRPRLTPLHGGLIAASVIALLIVPLAFMRAPQTVADPLVRQPEEAPQPAAPRPSVAHPIVVANASPIARPLAAVAPRSAPKPDAAVKPAAIEEPVAAPPPRPEKAPRIAAPAPAPLAPLERQQARTVVKTEKPLRTATANCLSAMPGAATAVCKNDNLAALDRLGEAFYGQSMKAGNATKRAALMGSRIGFLGRREACRTEPCLRSAYLAHMREISAIVENKPPHKTAQ